MSRLKVKLIVGPEPELCLQQLIVDGRTWRGDDRLSVCVGQGAGQWLPPRNGRFFFWRGIVQELCGALNTDAVELTVLGEAGAGLREELERQSAGREIVIRFEDERKQDAGEEFQERLADLCRTHAGAGWLRRSLEKICKCLSARKVRLVYDSSRLRSGAAASELEKRLCRYGDPALFRLALVGARADEDALRGLAELDDGPLAVCVSGADAVGLEALLPGAFVFRADDEWELLAGLDQCGGEAVLLRRGERLLSELAEDIDEEKDWKDPAAGQAALEQLMLWLKEREKGVADE